MNIITSLIAIFLLTGLPVGAVAHAVQIESVQTTSVQAEQTDSNEGGTTATTTGAENDSRAGGDPDRPMTTGGANASDKATPKLLEASVGGTHNEDTDADAAAVQYNESDIDFLRGSAVSVKAVEVRGWDPKEKQEFLATVKTHAQIESKQDLDNFAKGVLVTDANVEAVVSSEEEVEVKYRVPAKFLGIFEASLGVTVSVEAQGEGEAESSVSERVKVKFPWLRIFFSISEGVREEALQEAVVSQVSAEIETQTQFELQAQARLFQIISNVLKVKHDTAKNSIQNVR